jgi:formate hydrogenlyase subunit 3/multisubunit Na+/H+ antiporter MnhD subunit
MPVWLDMPDAWHHALLVLAPLFPLLLALLSAHAGSARWTARAAPLATLPAWILAFAGPAERAWPDLLLGLVVGIDLMRSAWLALTLLLWTCATWFGVTYMAHDEHRRRYQFFLLGAMSGNLGLILARDPVTFFSFFALMSLMSYGLVIHDGRPDSLRAGRVYLGMALLGEMLQFAALGLLFFDPAAAAMSGSGLTMDQLANRPVSPVAIGLLLAGFGVKAGLLGLHVWLPMAHPVAPTPASAVLSGSMIKAGLIGWMTFLPLGYAAYPGLGSAVALLGVAGALLAALAGLLQTHPKAVLAYSSVSQMGLMITAVGLGLLDPATGKITRWIVLLYALHHGIAKCLLFLSVGLRSVRPMRGLEKTLFWSGTVFAAIALIGAPFTSGAVAKSHLKYLVKDSVWAGAPTIGLLLTAAAAGTTLLMIRYLVTLRRIEPDPHHTAPARILLPWVFLLVAALAATPAAAGWWMTRGGMPPAPMLDAVTLLLPLLAGAALYAIAARALRLHTRTEPLIPPGDLAAWMHRAWTRLKPERRNAEPLAAPAAPSLSAHPALGFLARTEDVLSRWTSGLAAIALAVLLLAALVWWTGS